MALELRKQLSRMEMKRDLYSNHKYQVKNVLLVVFFKLIQLSKKRLIFQKILALAMFAAEVTIFTGFSQVKWQKYCGSKISFGLTIHSDFEDTKYILQLTHALHLY